MFQYSNEVGKRLDKLREDSSNLNRSDNLKCHRYISLYCSDENTNKLGFFIHYTFSKDYYNNQTCEFSDETVGVEYWKFIDAEMLWASEIIKNKYPDLVKNCTHTSMWRIISRPKKSGYLNKLNAIQDLDNDIENHCMKAENYYTSCEYSGDHIF